MADIVKVLNGTQEFYFNGDALKVKEDDKGGLEVRTSSLVIAKFKPGWWTSWQIQFSSEENKQFGFTQVPCMRCLERDLSGSM